MTKLQTLREKRGLTRAELAVKAKCSERTLWNYEEREQPARPIIQLALSRVLRSKVSDLFDANGKALAKGAAA